MSPVAAVGAKIDSHTSTNSKPLVNTKPLIEPLSQFVAKGLCNSQGDVNPLSISSPLDHNHHQHHLHHHRNAHADSAINLKQVEDSCLTKPNQIIGSDPPYETAAAVPPVGSWLSSLFSRRKAGRRSKSIASFSTSAKSCIDLSISNIIQQAERFSADAAAAGARNSQAEDSNFRSKFPTLFSNHTSKSPHLPPADHMPAPRKIGNGDDGVVRLGFKDTAMDGLSSEKTSSATVSRQSVMNPRPSICKRSDDSCAPHNMKLLDFLMVDSLDTNIISDSAAAAQLNSAEDIRAAVYVKSSGDLKRASYSSPRLSGISKADVPLNGLSAPTTTTISSAAVAAHQLGIYIYRERERDIYLYLHNTEQS